ncbi:hypothetical protein EV644_11263 [Kribbella orskensis]|uniref:Uncharacterized protein n=1 Tax=Kribbella orskensis TaxID=2512216 RepID=A0ABY2BHF0_9ACTN|nr:MULTISPECIES: hypothetical protein [Kribbella]TCN36891.1 hypothetical protein EV642_11363 [Kribbella sp. VKM Ac-2500]TCO18315.1 hypothetical protein EV644_11263 [Kribbella orskensis]
MKLATFSTWTELLLLLIAFVLSMVIGVERGRGVAGDHRGTAEGR